MLQKLHRFQMNLMNKIMISLLLLHQIHLMLLILMPSHKTTLWKLKLIKMMILKLMKLLTIIVLNTLNVLTLILLPPPHTLLILIDLPRKLPSDLIRIMTNMIFTPTVVSININGLSSHHKLSSLLHKISHLHPHVICIQETFTSQLSLPSSFYLSLYKSLWPGQFYYSKHLITLIHPSFSSTLSFMSQDERIMDISVSSSSSSFVIRNIYAPPRQAFSSQFWSSFPSLPPSPNLICAGDFNVTTQLRDRWSSAPHSRNLPFVNLIPKHFPNMIDLAGSLPGSPHFTCFHINTSYISKSRIDYILISPSFFSLQLSSFTVCINPLSDHRAVILKPKPSHKQTLWRMNTSYLSLPHVQADISRILSSYAFPTHPSLWDSCKLDIKNYYSSISSSFSKKNKAAITNLTNRIQNLQNSPNPNYSLISRLQAILSKLHEKSQISLILRSRIKWYEQGETSSSYFFKRFHSTQTSMSIDSLYIPSSSPDLPEILSNDSKDILQHAKNYFTSLWSSPPSLPSSTPLTTYIPTLSQPAISSLDSPITPQELFDTIKQKKDNSAPGPDGIPYKFYKLFPIHISNILLPIFSMISSGSHPPPYSWSQTITTLIHKKNTDPHHITNLRPITLANTDIKLLSTILANRFQSFAASLIHPYQTGFMRSHYIYDTVLDINSYLTMNNPPPQSFVLSIDWSKAYDRVSHSWLDHI